MQAGAMGQGGEVFVLDMGKPIKIIDLAREMIKLSGFEPDVDIPIVYIGIRPGEKLFEELLTAEEGSMATQSNKIFVVKLALIDEKNIIECLDKLADVIMEFDNKPAIVAILKQVVPRFLR
jgi:FlaA1/EpsC-like NDP-sugar epimerase